MPSRSSRLQRSLARPALVAMLMTWACSSSQAPAPSVVDTRSIAPAEANAKVTQFPADHVLWIARGTAPAPRIMLLLSGTGGRPANHQLIGRTAAEQGYRVIGLMYPNDRAVVNECAGDPDAACMANMRREIVDGDDVSPHVTVDRDNSISGRLADLLRLLARRFPNESWESFLEGDGSPRWSTIAVGGLSQGGGHAAYIAKTRAVPRVVMFGAPADGYGAQKAPWMQIGATPAERYFGFHHARDPFTSIDPNWRALGLDAFGVTVDVGADTRDFRGSHMFTTDLLPGTGSYDAAHPSVFNDGVTPLRADGTPVFDAVWRYLLGSGRQ